MQRHDHVLPDGTTVTLRPITPDDDARILGMWERTSAESRRRRFLGPFRMDEETVKRFTNLDPDLQFAVVATRGRGDDERIVGVARYERDPDARHEAEFAALIEDGEQGRGIGTALVRQVAIAANEAGITQLTGDILADNVRMLNLVRELGLEYRSDRDEGGVVRSDLEVAFGDRFLDVIDASDRTAAQAALTRFFRPERIAVVGASRDPQAIGALVLNNLLEGGFQGVVYPVNPNAEYVQGVATYAELADCPRTPDLVVVCVPAALVNDVVDQAGDLGIAAVCVVTSGFAESGDEGQARQDDLLERARGHGLRLIGPNCMGLLNGSPDVRMNATFARTFPAPGRVSMSSQSGALGLAVLRHMNRLGLGISTFVSVGNKADISGNDLLLYWEDDPDTDVVLMYLESFGNPRKFSRIARRMSRSKPIVAVKSGRTSSGVRAASSHTAAISSGDTAVGALFEQTGVIRTDTLEEMFDVATLLASQGLPGGTKVAVLTNAGGPAILAADALESNGLDLPTLSERTQEELAGFLPAEAGIGNPVDMIASASSESYTRALRVLGHADEVDIIFVIFIPAGITDSSAVIQALIDARADVPEHVPLVAVVMSNQARPDELTAAGVATFSFPETAARALGRVARYAGWRRRPLGNVVTPDGLDPAAARRVVEQELAQAETPTGVWASNESASAILGAYGVPLGTGRIVQTPDEGADVQREMDRPVTVKLTTEIHKADVGGVVLDLTTPEDVSDAIRDMQAHLQELGLGEHAENFLVQEMVDDGIEMVVGVTHDPSFGPIVLTGAGGTLVELLGDVSVRITPLTDHDVDGMLDRLRMSPQLRGYRGAPPADVAALKDLLHRINAMVEDLPEIAELDLNPVFVLPDGQGVVAVDVRMKLVPAE